jgi:TRAP-type C4-dicarboxylate transport system substrate-binding protein
MFKIQVCKRLIMIFSIFVFVMSFIMIAPSEAAETLKIRMAGQSPLEHQATIHQMKFAKEIEEATDGRIQIKVYPANQLGDYIQVYEEVIKGSRKIMIRSKKYMLLGDFCLIFWMVSMIKLV